MHLAEKPFKYFTRVKKVKCSIPCLNISRIIKELPKLPWVWYHRVQVIKRVYMILMYSFFIILRLILELIYENTISKWLNRISTLSNCTLHLTILSLLNGIPSGNIQLWMSRMMKMINRILLQSTTLASIWKFYPSPVSSPKHSFKHKMIELTCNMILFLWNLFLVKSFSVLYPDKSTHNSH